MIKYNNSNINDWYFDTSNIIKVYRNNAVCYYKIDVSSPSGQTPCFAVVVDISQYSDREFIDVFETSSGKWYKLNNLNQYEEYGLYGSGRTITTYEGKLTIDEEVTPPPSRLPQGYTEVEYVENTSQAYLNLGVVLYDGDGTTWSISTRFASEPQAPSWDTFAYLLSTENTASPYYGFTMRWQNGYNFSIGGNPDNLVYDIVDNGDGTSGATITCPNATTNNNTPLTMFVGTDGNFGQDYWRNGTGKFYALQLTKNNVLVRNLVPAKRNSDNEYGMYDLVTDTFYTSPNGYSLSGGSELPSTTATCEFMYSGGSWINVGEVSGSTATLPDIDFSINYNAANYISTAYTIPQTEGQLQNVDAVCNYGYKIVDHSADGYISVTGNSRFVCNGNSGTYLNRSNTQANCPMTIVSKAKTTSGYSIFTNRTSSARQYMYRQDKTYAYLCGSGATSEFTCSDTVPSILSVRVYYDSGIKAKWNNWTTSASSTPEVYGYNNQNLTNGGALFCDYTNSNSEFWQGDFYWIYMSQNALTDEQVQQVITYNEGGGGEPTYPLYYDEMQDPPNNVTFTSMTEAEEYECPWVGMRVTINGSAYTFNDNYEWEEVTSYWSVDTTQWQTSTAYGNLPSSGYSFYQSFSNHNVDNATATTYITIYGFDTFDFKIRSYGESCCDYVIVYDLDSESNEKLVDNNNPQELQWRDVSFSGISTNVEHTIKVIYKKDSSVNGYDDRGYIAIPRQVVATSTTVVQGEYICYQGDKYQKLEVLVKYEGSSEWIHTGTYIRGNLIEASSTDCQNRLPEGYTEVEYIENTDYASLEINYHPNQDTRIVTTMQAVSTNENTYGRFIGSGTWNDADGNHGYQFDYEEYPTGQLHISWGAESGWDTNNSVYGDYNVHTYDWNKNEFYIDNTLVASTTYQNFTCENNLGIFAQIMYNGRTPYLDTDENKEYLRGKLYSFQAYDDGTLAIELVPCINPNNVVGVYDIINNVFYTAVNQGYYFVAGPSL